MRARGRVRRAAGTVSYTHLDVYKRQGLHGVRMVVGDKASGMVGSIAEVFPEAAYQRCTVHFYRNVLALSLIHI